MNGQSTEPSMQPDPVRQQPAAKFHWWKVVVILIVFPGIGCLSYGVWSAAWKARERWIYQHECDRIAKVIKSLNDRRPATVGKRVWDNGVGWTVTAHYNVCFSPGHTDLAAMVHFGETLDDRLQRDVDLSIFEWIWDRLAETGPHGKKYTDGFRPSLREDLQPDTKMRWGSE